MCPCKKPLVTLKNGTINIANDTNLNTNTISSTVLPPVPDTAIIDAIGLAKMNNSKNMTNDNMNIIVLDILYTLETSSLFSSAKYSLVNLLTAKGNPAEDIDKNKAYIL